MVALCKQCIPIVSSNRPVRMHLDIDTNMKMIGKRFPYYATYTVSQLASQRAVLQSTKFQYVQQSKLNIIFSHITLVHQQYQVKMKLRYIIQLSLQKQLLYSGKLLREKTFANSEVLQLSGKVFSMKFGDTVSFGGTSEQSTEVFFGKIFFHQFTKVFFLESFLLFSTLEVSKLQLLVCK